MTQLFEKEFDQFTGAVKSTYASEDGTVTQRSVIDLSHLLDKNKEDRNAGNNGFSQSHNLRKIAEIDPVTQLKLLKDHNIDMCRWNEEDQKRFKKWLSQSENAYFRTYSGKI
jgi:hypothetical protein